MYNGEGTVAMGSQAKLNDSRNVGMGRLDGPAPIGQPEIGRSMNNLEAELEGLYSVGNGILSRLDGVLRPEYAKDSGEKGVNAERESKAPIAEHADRIALSVRAYRRTLENIAERLAL